MFNANPCLSYWMGRWLLSPPSRPMAPQMWCHFGHSLVPPLEPPPSPPPPALPSPCSVQSERGGLVWRPGWQSAEPAMAHKNMVNSGESCKIPAKNWMVNLRYLHIPPNKIASEWRCCIIGSIDPLAKFKYLARGQNMDNTIGPLNLSCE